jgi:hypothetical protein
LEGRAAAGSPVRYYLPVGPVTVAATLSALTTGWRNPVNRPWSIASTAGTLTGALATAYIVREINVKLFFATETPTATEQEKLLKRWYRLNAVRMAATGVAWLSARQISRRKPSS